MEELIKEIQRKCRKRLEFLTPRDKAEDDEYQEENVQKEVNAVKIDEIVEELPFEEILAEKRHKYTAKDEFIYSLYNDVLPTFVIEWDGHFLRKKSLMKSYKDSVETIRKSEEIEDDRDESNDLAIAEKQEENDKTKAPSWKLSLPDEFANIKFYNGNSYCGRISRKMMEGEGIYRWNNGVQYKGQFEQNQIQGKGLLKWNNDCWYEGDFMDGLRHGKGTMIDRKYNHMYVSYWYMGYKQRKK